MKWIRSTLNPICLMIFCPLLSMLLWHTVTVLDGSLLLLYKIVAKHGFFSVAYELWAPHFFGSTTAWLIIFSFIAFQCLLIKIVPGKSFKGLDSGNGEAAEYKNNGFLCYLITLTTYTLLSYQFRFFSPTLIFEHFGELIAALSLLAFIVSFGLLLKGPRSHLIYDYYWGTELYPRIFGIEIKQLIKSRLAMMSWPLILFSFATAQAHIFGLTNSMVLSVGLQILYITNYFYWEENRFQSVDIMYDKTGFYIVWATLVWIPFASTAPALYLVSHPHQLSTFTVATLLFLGLALIAVLHFTDRQKTQLNASEPLDIGFFGLARHFHYLPLLLLAFVWSLPALFSHFYPYFYVAYIGLYSFDKTRKDELYCQELYGESWKKHCEKVPYKLIPFIY